MQQLTSRPEAPAANHRVIDAQPGAVAIISEYRPMDNPGPIVLAHQGDWTLSEVWGEVRAARSLTMRAGRLLQLVGWLVGLRNERAPIAATWGLILSAAAFAVLLLAR
jgi:hypothetical protein